MNYFNKINLSKVVKTVDFGVLVPIDINPDNKIISPPTRPFSSVIIIIGQSAIKWSVIVQLNYQLTYLSIFKNVESRHRIPILFLLQRFTIHENL